MKERKPMPEGFEDDEYYNPAVIHFPAGLNDQQLRTVRNSLRRFMESADGENLNPRIVADEITAITGVNVRREVIRRFLAGYYGTDRTGKDRKPEIRNQQAITSYLLSPDVGAITLRDLEQPCLPFDLPNELSIFLVEHRTTSGEMNELVRHYTFQGEAARPSETRTLSVRRPGGAGYMFVEEVRTALDNAQSKIDTRRSMGWVVFTPTNVSIFILKDFLFDNISLYVGRSPLMNEQKTQFSARFLVAELSDLSYLDVPKDDPAVPVETSQPKVMRTELLFSDQSI